MRARTRLALVAVVYLTLVVACATSSTMLLRRWDRAVAHRDAVLVASEELTRLQGAFADQETGVRGFIIAGNAAFLEPYEAGRKLAEALMPALQRSAVVDPDVATVLDDVQRSATAWQQHASQIITATPTSSQSSELQIERVAESKRLFDELRARFTDARLTFAELDSEAGRAADQAEAAAKATGLSIFGLAVVFTVVFGWLVRRWFTQPLAEIAAATREVSAGRPAHFPERGSTEILEVSRAVNDMQRTIVAQRDAAVRAREAIEQSAALALQMRSELAHELGSYPSGWTVAAGLVPADGIVAGDCYDVGLIDSQTMGFIVLDIAGHGATSAIAALKCKELLKAALRSGMQPGDALNALFESENGLDDSFVTAIVVLLDVESGECRYANAGHPPGFIVDGDGRRDYLLPTGPLLGPVPGTWLTSVIQLPNDCKLVLYTDGLVEARDKSKMFFGEEAVVQAIGSMSCETVHAVIRTMFDRIAEFNDGHRLADDVTLVVACRTSPDEAVEPT
jgi:CHASE3 domain sensor protein